MTGDLVAAAAVDASLILNPATGEIADANDPAQVITILASLRDLIAVAVEQRRNAEAALAEHARTLGTRTFEIDGQKVEVRGGDRVEYDPDILEQLLDVGLPEERWNALVKLEVKTKIDGHVARQLAGANERYAAIVEKAKTVVPGNLYVKVDAR